MLRLLGWVGLGALLLTVVAAGVQSSARVSELPWVPGSLGRWADQPALMYARHWFAFMALTWLSLHMVGWEVRLARQRGEDLVVTARRYPLLIVLGAVGMVLLIEVLQLWLPQRSADLPDLLCGLVGVASGRLAYRRVQPGAGYV
jgi:hypothetical protein